MIENIVYILIFIMKTEAWLSYFSNTKRVLNSITTSCSTIDLESKIYFPVYFPKEKGSYGSIVEITNSETKIEVKNSTNSFLDFQLSFTQENAKDGMLSDLEKVKSSINNVIIELITKKFKNNNHYKESLDFLKLTYKPTLNLITDENCNIGDTSYSLALAIDILNSAINFIPNGDTICFTGSFKKENEILKIEKVEGIEEKLIAVLTTNINKFIIPLKNKEKVLDIVKLKDTVTNNYNVTKPNSKNLKLIFADTLEDVLENLYGNNFFESSSFRYSFDLGYRYKQKTLVSNLVKIKSVFNIFDSKRSSNENDIQSYVKIKSLIKNDSHLPIEPHEIFYNFEEKNENIIITGDSGSGKSSILKRFLILICKEGQDGEAILEALSNFDKLPIFLDFKTITSKSYKEETERAAFIRNIMISHLEKISLEQTYLTFLEKLYNNNKLIFILDGYDEEEIKVELLPEKSAIISSKYQEKLSGAFYKVLPMTNEAKNKFIISYVENKEENLKKIKDLEIGDLFSKPLFLALFLLVINEDEKYLEEIKTQTQLINIVINKFLSKESNYSSLQVLSEFKKIDTKIALTSKLLKEIAFSIFTNNNFLKENDFENIIFTKLINEINLIQGCKFVSYTDLEDILKYLSNSFGIIEKIETGTGYKFVFFHNVFYEFFLAKYFVEDFSSEEKKEWITLNLLNLKRLNIFRIITYLIKIREDNLL